MSTQSAIAHPGLPGAPDPSPGEYPLGRRGSLETLALLCLLMAFDFADRMIVAALLPSIRAQWGLSDAQSGLLSTVLFASMVVFAFPAAIAIDRWGRVRTAGLMGLFWGGASASGALTRGFGQLLLSRAAVGVGEAGYAPAAYAWICAVFPRRRQQLALGIFSASQPIGMALGVALGAYIASRYGWRHALGLMAAPGLVIAALIFRARDYPNPPPEQSSAGHSVRRNLGIIFSTPSLVLTYLSTAMGTLQWVPIFYFLPTFLHRVHGLPLTTASYLTSSLSLVGIFAIPAGGWLMDRANVRDPRAKIVFAAAVAALGTVFYALAFGMASDHRLQYGLIIAAFIVTASGGTAALSMAQELAPAGARALSGSCAIITLHLLGSVPGPLVAGMLSDRFGLQAALSLIAVLGGSLSVLALLLARLSYRADLQRNQALRFASARP